MRRLTKKEVIKIALTQNKCTKEFLQDLEKYFARYQLRLIEQEELFKTLNLEN